MAVTAKWYTNAFINAFGSGDALGVPIIDWKSDEIKVMLFKSTYTPNRDTHAFKDDINAAANEVAGSGNYTTGGATLSSKTLTVDEVTHSAVFDAADTQWTNSTISNAYYAIIYDDSPATDATKPLIGYVDFGQNRSSSGTTFKIAWDSTGILRIDPEV